MLRSCRATALVLAAFVVALVAALLAAPASAKNDIRGVFIGTPLADQIAQLELDGARCGPLIGAAARCVYDEHTTMTLFCKPAAPHVVEKIVYAFAFADLARMRSRLRELYGLRRDHIEGEHALFTGERLIVALDGHGKGTLTIVGGARLPGSARAAH